jgi:tRNA (guanine10-N2)-dimethyltransferase
MAPKLSYFVYLAGDLPEAGAAELISLVRSIQQLSLQRVSDRLFILNGDIDIERLWRQMALIRWAGKIHAQVNELRHEELKELPWSKILPASQILIALHGFEGQVKTPVENLILSAIEASDCRVELKPSRARAVLHIFRASDSFYIGTSTPPPRRRWFDRRPRARPFFHPTALHPRLARLMVNLAGSYGNAVLLDPFCGTGSIPLEASLIGLRSLASDISLKMCKGALLNARHFGIVELDVVQADARHLPFRYVDAIVTDLPYGRSSSLYGMRIGELLHSFFDELALLMKRQRRCVILHSHELEKYIQDTRFSRLYRFRIPVHRKLTRILTILEKS